jgi:hypothetical protein
MGQSAWLKRLGPMLRAERLLGQAAVFMRCRFQAQTDERNSRDRSVGACRKILGCETWAGFSRSDQRRLGLAVEKYALDDMMSECLESVARGESVLCTEL